MRNIRTSKRQQLFVFLLPVLFLCINAKVFSQQTALTGQEIQSISLTDAAALTHNYMSAGAAGMRQAEFFSQASIKNILNQNGCIGIRIYYGKKTDGTPVLVLVGVDAQGGDMTDGPLTEKGFPCPPICDSTSSLGH